ncbi:hypothetical protein GCM10011588_66810 [Nocardia jinanensis]|uniref:DUF742 domain-containing protein n=1 Tax=Nocardia jinanensis TaxID=382504 RepID=A0A917RXG4_9NOCA|nr:hypothetical protein GCM10011588_66810 [Nocardia jinanensis]
MSQFGQGMPDYNTGGPGFGPGAEHYGPGAQNFGPGSSQYNTGAYRFDAPAQPKNPRRAGRVRPYALTSGRTQPAVDLPMEAVIETISYHAQFDWPSGDIRAEILRLGTHQLSVAEIAAHLDRSLGMVRVVIGDLVVDGNLRVHSTLTEQASYDERRSLMERTLRGLRAL